MCVIVYKPSDVKVISKNILQQCWDRNDDGAGFAYKTAERDESGQPIWRAQKGFMKWKEFWKAFNEHQFTKKDTYVCHFRIKTHGFVDAGNTHPFQVADNYTAMRQLDYTTTDLVFHNGTCGQGEDVEEGGVKIEASDTMKFVKEFVYPLSKYIDGDGAIDKILTHLFCDTRDRWLYIHGEREWMYGDFKEEDGVYYSNLLWKTYSVTRGTGRSIASQGHNNDYWNTNLGLNNDNWYGESSEKERTGIVDTEGNVIWDDESEEDEDAIVLCPNCLEDKYLDESPFEGVGDTLCQKCGAVFNDDDGKIWMYDEDIKAKAQNTSSGS